MENPTFTVIRQTNMISRVDVNHNKVTVVLDDDYTNFTCSQNSPVASENHLLSIPQSMMRLSSNVMVFH